MDEDDEILCPLCLEKLDETDRNFKPCVCGYQICQFCWHHIRKELNGLCPACRRTYEDQPSEFIAVPEEARRKAKQRAVVVEKRKETPDMHGRHRLINVRVVQKNLVYIIGIPLRLASEDLLRSQAYLGQYGKVTKVVINRRPVNTNGTPTVSAYITFVSPKSADACIRAVDGITLDNCLFRASFGTTKYCNQFLRGFSCHNPDCMYLHDDGDKDMSFTKEEMQHGQEQRQGLTFGPPLQTNVHCYSDSKGNVLPPVPDTPPLTSDGASDSSSSSSASSARTLSSSGAAPVSFAPPTQTALPKTATWKSTPATADAKTILSPTITNPNEWPSVSSARHVSDGGVNKETKPKATATAATATAPPSGPATTAPTATPSVAPTIAAIVAGTATPAPVATELSVSTDTPDSPTEEAPTSSAPVATPAPVVYTPASSLLTGSPEKMNAKARRELKRALRLGGQIDESALQGSSESSTAIGGNDESSGSSPEQNSLADDEATDAKESNVIGEKTETEMKMDETLEGLSSSFGSFQLFGGPARSLFDLLPANGGQQQSQENSGSAWMPMGTAMNPATSSWAATANSSAWPDQPDPLSALRNSASYGMTSSTTSYTMPSLSTPYDALLSGHTLPTSPTGQQQGGFPASPASSIWSSPATAVAAATTATSGPARRPPPPPASSGWGAAAMATSSSMLWDPLSAYPSSAPMVAPTQTAPQFAYRTDPSPRPLAGQARPRPTLSQQQQQQYMMYQGAPQQPPSVMPTGIRPRPALQQQPLYPGHASSSWGFATQLTPEPRVIAPVQPPPGFRNIFAEPLEPTDATMADTVAGVLGSFMDDVDDELAPSAPPEPTSSLTSSHTSSHTSSSSDVLMALLRNASAAGPVASSAAAAHASSTATARPPPGLWGPAASGAGAPRAGPQEELREADVLALLMSDAGSFSSKGEGKKEKGGKKGKKGETSAWDADDAYALSAGRVERLEKEHRQSLKEAQDAESELMAWMRKSKQGSAVSS